MITAESLGLERLQSAGSLVTEHETLCFLESLND